MSELGGLAAAFSSAAFLLARSRRLHVLPANARKQPAVGLVSLVGAAALAWLSWRFFAAHGWTTAAPALVTAWIGSMSSLVLLASAKPLWARALTLIALTLTATALATGGLHAT